MLHYLIFNVMRTNIIKLSRKKTKQRSQRLKWEKGTLLRQILRQNKIHQLHHISLYLLELCMIWSCKHLLTHLWKFLLLVSFLISPLRFLFVSYFFLHLLLFSLCASYKKKFKNNKKLIWNLTVPKIFVFPQKEFK